MLQDVLGELSKDQANLAAMIREGSLDPQNTNFACNEAYDSILDLAAAQSDWKKNMVPVRRENHAAILWVANDVALDACNQYKICNYLQKVCLERVV
jgi:hypothetical protein